MIKAGIIGGTGLTAGELLHLLLLHEQVEVAYITSTSQVGSAVSSVHDDLLGATELVFVEKPSCTVDVVFLCVGHGISKTYLKENQFDAGTKIIDLSADFRLKETSEGYVYGLSEIFKEAIQNTNYVANPGCFATAIQLGLAPLAAAQKLEHPVHIHSLTGSTGAGKGFMGTTQFHWRSNNVSVYKPFGHQHLHEIKETLATLQHSTALPRINFVPMRGNFARGIFCSMYLESNLSTSVALALFKKYYESPFVVISDQPIHLKQAVNTNKCFIHVQQCDGQLHLTTAIDNLLKGAVGQAVQNMNLMFGLKEDLGLQLKAMHY